LENGKYTWIIAPANANSIALRFLRYDMRPEVFYTGLTVEECSDAACTRSTLLKQGPNITTANVSTGFARVAFSSMWGGHSQANFILYYKANSIGGSGLTGAACPGISTDGWHHIMAVGDMDLSRTASARIYVNGTLKSGPAYPFRSAGSQSDLVVRFRFAGRAGAAMGRVHPMSVPFGHLPGEVDNVAVWSRNLSSIEIQMSMAADSCARSPLSTGLLACFDFEETSRASTKSFRGPGDGLSRLWYAVAVRSDRFMPWCVNMNDGGSLQALMGQTAPVPYGQSWGFCADRPYLPGHGFEYDPEKLVLTAGGTDSEARLDTILRLPGCVSVALLLDSNKAAR
jgi:hypothetical protein